MPTPEQKKKLLKAKIAVALHDELGRVPTMEEIDRVFLLTRVSTKQCSDCISNDRSRRRPGNWRSSKDFPFRNIRTNTFYI
jgi:hypothetical protein